MICASVIWVLSSPSPGALLACVPVHDSATSAVMDEMAPEPSAASATPAASMNGVISATAASAATREPGLMAAATHGGTCRAHAVERAWHPPDVRAREGGQAPWMQRTHPLPTAFRYSGTLCWKVKSSRPTLSTVTDQGSKLIRSSRQF